MKTFNPTLHDGNTSTQSCSKINPPAGATVVHLGKIGGGDAPDKPARGDARPTKLYPASGFKRWFGYTHFLLKGLEKVRCEWSLITTVYNLKRVLNLVSFEKLMAAVS